MLLDGIYLRKTDNGSWRNLVVVTGSKKRKYNWAKMNKIMYLQANIYIILSTIYSYDRWRLGVSICILSYVAWCNTQNRTFICSASYTFFIIYFNRHKDVKEYYNVKDSSGFGNKIWCRLKHKLNKHMNYSCCRNTAHFSWMQFFKVS